MEADDSPLGKSAIARREVPAGAYREISPRAQDVLDRIEWTSFSGMKHVYGFNYQPSWGHDATSIWLDRFNPEQYRHELATGRRYFPAFNCVRIWLGYRPYQASSEALVRHFNAAVDIATELELLVIPVLFTVWSGTPPFDPVSLRELMNADFERAYAPYLRDLVAPHRQNRSILAWDLCNEPMEGDTLDPKIQRQAAWLGFLHDRVKSLDPDARTCIGTISDFGWGQGVAQYCDVLTPHMYGYSIWKPAFDQLQVRMEFEPWFECMVDQYVIKTTILNKPKPILSTETCWGARDALERKRIIRGTLSALARHGVGFLPHALYTSGVADLHFTEENEYASLSSVASPASMAFVNADGTLRPGHEVFNEYAPANAAGSGAVPHSTEGR